MHTPLLALVVYIALNVILVMCGVGDLIAKHCVFRQVGDDRGVECMRNSSEEQAAYNTIYSNTKTM